MQSAEKVEGKQAILSREHHPWIYAVLNEHSTQVYQILISDQFKTFLKFAF
jgi:hypothetical protein